MFPTIGIASWGGGESERHSQPSFKHTHTPEILNDMFTLQLHLKCHKTGFWLSKEDILLQRIVACYILLGILQLIITWHICLATSSTSMERISLIKQIILMHHLICLLYFSTVIITMWASKPLTSVVEWATVLQQSQSLLKNFYSRKLLLTLPLEALREANQLPKVFTLCPNQILELQY